VLRSYLVWGYLFELKDTTNERPNDMRKGSTSLWLGWVILVIVPWTRENADLVMPTRVNYMS
jgi:hypothetical protein